MSDFTRGSFRRTVVDRGDGTGEMPAATVLRDGTATGPLAGGNLALVASLCGTPWAIDFRGAIVVLEDINEATYRLDRMLTQLRLAGAFDGCAGFLFGQFTSAPWRPTTARGRWNRRTGVRDAFGVPAVLGAPFGHGRRPVDAPLGAIATLDATRGALRVHGLD
jgi:muramoyltetrapeptide carboxypeptidase